MITKKINGEKKSKQLFMFIKCHPKLDTPKVKEAHGNYPPTGNWLMFKMGFIIMTLNTQETSQSFNLR